MPVSN
ncbi:09eaae47-49af-484c-ace0-1876287fa915 [Thermothielavioides terrestris]